MSDAGNPLVDGTARILRDLCTRAQAEAAETGAWPRALWDALAEAGVTGAAMSEARGGAGAEAADLYALARVIGYYAVPLPLVEGWLAEQMLAAAGLPPVAGCLTVGPVLRIDALTLRPHANGWLLRGELAQVPWGRHAEALVAIAASAEGERTVVVRAPRAAAHGHNLAAEPRDTLRFDDVALAAADVGPPDAGCSRAELFFRGALFRTLQVAGAMDRVLELTIAYAKERVQFGRPIGKFQAVQQQIAVLATEAAAARAAAQGAADANAGRALARFEIAAAKARAGEAVARVAAIAHQVHGAMGFTHEHSLHLATRRLWSWRDEFGTENEWMAWVGRVAVQLGGEGLWPFLVAARKPDVPASLP